MVEGGTVSYDWAGVYFRVRFTGRKERHIEFVGESYTCGYGTESCDRNDLFLAETENCNLTYAAITARYFGASWHPNYKGHKKVASCMIPYISTLTGWEMTEKPYR